MEKSKCIEITDYDRLEILNVCVSLHLKLMDNMQIMRANNGNQTAPAQDTMT